MPDLRLIAPPLIHETTCLLAKGTDRRPGSACA